MIIDRIDIDVRFDIYFGHRHTLCIIHCHVRFSSIAAKRAVRLVLKHCNYIVKKFLFMNIKSPLSGVRCIMVVAAEEVWRRGEGGGMFIFSQNP